MTIYPLVEKERPSFGLPMGDYGYPHEVCSVYADPACLETGILHPSFTIQRVSWMSSLRSHDHRKAGIDCSKYATCQLH